MGQLFPKAKNFHNKPISSLLMSTMMETSSSQTMSSLDHLKESHHCSTSQSERTCRPTPQRQGLEEEAADDCQDNVS